MHFCCLGLFGLLQDRAPAGSHRGCSTQGANAQLGPPARPRQVAHPSAPIPFRPFPQSCRLRPLRWAQGDSPCGWRAGKAETGARHPKAVLPERTVCVHVSMHVYTHARVPAHARWRPSALGKAPRRPQGARRVGRCVGTGTRSCHAAVKCTWHSGLTWSDSRGR